MNIGADLHGQMINDAKAAVEAKLAAEGLHPTEDEALYVEIGIAAGIMTAVQALADSGLLSGEAR